MIEAFMSESEDEIDNNEENIEDSIIEINQSGYPYKKVFYEEDECCSSLKEVSSIKRKISENDEPCNSREPSVKKLTVEEVQKQLYSEVKKSALSNDTAFKTFLTEICRFRRGANKTWKLMIFCGFKNKESFIEKIKKSLTHEDAIEQMQTVIDRSSRVKLKKIGMKKTIQKFKFTSFQVQTIKDIFNAVEELILSEMTDDCNDNN
ncbi:hypothetical protein PVAND_006826 [Polypedilum vanderplanki]|uniref:Uncharacterized protein n=1 Tax=Polypedilum vanderplanki TaxID=319348 RepID=A0A9J6C4G7_POLVA|nr:hypothetical protein PVAND_006826 [Polypedilum vanderplanki]